MPTRSRSPGFRSIREKNARPGQAPAFAAVCQSLAIGIAVLEVGDRLSGFQVSRPNAYHQGVDAIIPFEQRAVGLLFGLSTRSEDQAAPAALTRGEQGLALIARAIRFDRDIGGTLAGHFSFVTRNRPNVARHRVDYNSRVMGRFSENPP